MLQFDIFDMALFTGVQHLYTLNIVSPLIYHLFPKVSKASYTIGASIFVDVQYLLPYSKDKLISCIVPGPSQWFFHFGEELIISWTQIGWVRRMLYISHCQRRKTSVTAAAVWFLALSWRMMGFCTTKCLVFSWVHGLRKNLYN